MTNDIWNGEVVLTSPSSGRVVQRFASECGITSVACADNYVLAAGDDAEVRFWSVDRKQLSPLLGPPPPDPLAGLGLSDDDQPDPETLGDIVMCDNVRIVSALRGHSDCITCIALDVPTEAVLSSSWDGFFESPSHISH
jgi:WD40 repeat protein